MPNAARLAIALDTTLGWRTVSENWKDLYPHNSPLAMDWIAFEALSSNRGQLRNKTVQRIVTRVNMGVAVNRLIRDLKPDAALVGNMALNLVQGRKKTPLFTMLDATQKQLQAFGSGYGIYPAKSRILENIKHGMRRRAYQACAGIFAFSAWAGRSLVADYGVDPRKIHVLHHGAVVERWPRRERRESSDRVCNIIFVGADFKRKGGEFLMNWAARTRNRQWRLTVVTQNKIDSADERITVHQGMAPGDPRLTDLFAEADLFVLPTLVDISPLAIAEAFAAGIPVVSSDVAAIPEMIVQGVTGFAIPLNQTERWEECLNLLIDDPALRRRMGAAARQDAEQRFDARKNIQITVDLIASTLETLRH